MPTRGMAAWRIIICEAVRNAHHYTWLMITLLTLSARQFHLRTLWHSCSQEGLTATLARWTELHFSRSCTTRTDCDQLGKGECKRIRAIQSPLLYSDSFLEANDTRLFDKKEIEHKTGFVLKLDSRSVNLHMNWPKNGWCVLLKWSPSDSCAATWYCCESLWGAAGLLTPLPCQSGLETTRWLIRMGVQTRTEIASHFEVSGCEDRWHDAV